jgi:uncharacterized membrane protein
MPKPKKKPSPRAKRATPTVQPVAGTEGAALVAGSKPQPTTHLRLERAAALTYLLGPVTGLFFLATDSRPEVRLQALQSLVFSAAVIASSLLLYYSLIGILLLPPLWLAALLVWLSAIWRAAVGIRWRMPIIYPLLKKGRLIK